MIIPGPASESNFRHRDPKLVRLMSEVYQARELVLANADRTVSEIARHAGRCRIRLDRLLKLARLSSSIVTAILGPAAHRAHEHHVAEQPPAARLGRAARDPRVRLNPICICSF